MAKVKIAYVYVGQTLSWEWRPDWQGLVTIAKRFKCRFDAANRKWNISDPETARDIVRALLEVGETAETVQTFHWDTGAKVPVSTFLSDGYADEVRGGCKLQPAVVIDGPETYIQFPLDETGEAGPDYAMYQGLAQIGCQGEFSNETGFRLQSHKHEAVEYMIADGKFPVRGVPKITEQPIILDMFDSGVVMPHQDVGVTYLYARKTALLADDMGLGKTMQAILAADQVRLDGKGKALVVVCPVSLMTNWQNELAKWESGYEEIFIIPYSRFKLLHMVKEKFKDGVVVIVDEAHYLKNPSSQRSKTFTRFVKDNPALIERLWFLTGTPVTKGFGDLWLMAHLMSHPLADKYGPSRLDDLGHTEVLKISGAMKTHMLMRKKIDVLDLPPKMRQVRSVDTNSETLQEAHLKILAMGRDALVLEHLMRIKRLTAEAKVEHTIELAQQILAEGRKVVVFSDHLDSMEKIREALAPFGIVVLNGSTKDRQGVVDRFQKEQRTRVFLGQIKAAGVGITLTASQDVIFNDFDWLPSNMHQAEDRCHRIGTKGTVSIYYLADCKLILDEILMKRLAERSAEIATFEQSKQTLLKEVRDWARGQLGEDFAGELSDEEAENEAFYVEA